MSFSINTNASSLSALQVLRNTQGEKEANQTAINTGKKVATAKDNAAVFSIAQSVRSQLSGLNALQNARSRDQGLLEVTLVGIQMIEDQLLEMKELAVAAADSGLDDGSRQALAEKYRQHRDMIDTIAGQSTFQGLNFIDSRESNFLTYGPNSAVTNGQTAYEPQPGQEVELTFDFAGSGKQDETISGTVAFYYRWQDTGGAWHQDDAGDRLNYFIGAADIDNETVTADGVPYTSPPVTWTVPDLPLAQAYEIYAEWGRPDDALALEAAVTTPMTSNPGWDGTFDAAYWPAEDNAQVFKDVYSEDKHHVIMSWSEYNSLHANKTDTAGATQRHVNTSNGYSVVPGDATANQTDKGDGFTVDMQIVRPSTGVIQFGADVSLYYEWQDTLGDWRRYGAALDTASIPASTVDTSNLVQLDDTAVFSSAANAPSDTLDGQTAFVELADLSFSGTIPDIGSANTIVRSRIVADVIAQHDGDLIFDTSSQRLNNLDYQVTANTQPIQGTEEAGSFLEALGGGNFSTTVTVDNPDPSITDFDGIGRTFLEYFDGASWQRYLSPLDSVSRNSGDASNPLSYNFDMTLPPLSSLGGAVEQARIVAEFDMRHDGIPQPTETLTFAAWDGATTSTQQTSTTTLLSWSDPASQHVTSRRSEVATKIETLDQENGTNRPMRESNLGSGGLFGLDLAGSDLVDAATSSDIVGTVGDALDQLHRLATYYGGQLKRVERMMDLETQMRDTLEVGIGNLVDADLAKESAKSQALQVKEQLGLQALGIANRSSELILSLFNK